MEAIISNLVARFEQGSLSRRELVQGLAMLAASGTAAAAQESLDFKSADIDHVSIHVANLQRSVDFYQKMFGFTVVSQDQAKALAGAASDRSHRLESESRDLCGLRMFTSACQQMV